MTNNIEITLLSKEEYNRYKDIIPFVKDDWWLRSRGYDNDYEYYVNNNGNLCSNHVMSYRGIRPALYITLPNQKFLTVGDHIRIGSKDFIILSWEDSNLFALCCEVIATCRFDRVTNEWNVSEIKEWLSTEGIRLIF